MWSHKVIILILCTVLATQEVFGVVNNPKSEETTNNNSSSESTISDVHEDSEKSSDGDDSLTAASSDSNRRDASLSLGDTYGPPAPVNTYLPSGSGNLNLPVPVYGVPDAASNNIVYPAPPADTPPPVSIPTYSLPQADNFVNLPSGQYGLPSTSYGPPSGSFGSLSHSYGPPLKYGVPHPPKGHYHGPIRSKPKPHYGVPRPFYGPPKYKKHFKRPFKPQSTYGPIPPFKDSFGPNKFNNYFGGSSNLFTGQSVSSHYGPPDTGIEQLHTSVHYGPPEPSPNPRPPHPGAPAPPTPPEIKYDGWQPIPGLVSKKPEDTYGLPQSNHFAGDLSYNNDLSPPPLSDQGLGSIVKGTNQGISDSYGAPLNAVTGSGGVVSSSAEALHGGSGIQNIKSIGYEILHGDSAGGGNHYQISDSYGAPPRDSFSPDGPYAAAHSYSNFKNGHSGLHTHITHSTSHRGYKGLSLVGGGLIPPSGQYGVPPSGEYGTPLYQSSSLNNIPPKQPVVLSEPLPTGLLDSGKDISSSFSLGGNSYLTPKPSSLYSLPNINTATSFQNVAHGSSVSGLANDHSSYTLDSSTIGSGSGLSSYNVPLGTVDGSYGTPNHGGSLSVGIDSHPPLTIDLTGGHYATNNYHLPNVPHDCSLNKVLPLPSLSYGVPSANSYTAALSSLTTNIGGGYNAPQPQALYGPPDLHTAQSQISSEIKINSVDEDNHGKEYGKSVAQSFGPNSELIQSQSLDLKNIPIQGALGSYTLQIQSAEGGPSQVPHTQVLNDGLLQSILAAIEQPNQNRDIQSPVATHHVTETEHIEGNYGGNQETETKSGDEKEQEESQASELSEVIVPRNPIAEEPVNQINEDATAGDASKNNENTTEFNLSRDDNIALYFSNDATRHKKKTEGEETLGENKEEAGVTNTH